MLIQCSVLVEVVNSLHVIYGVERAHTVQCAC